MAACLLAVTLASTLAAGEADQSTRGDPIEVFLGQSQLIDAPWPITRVAVADPDIVNVQVLTPQQVLLQGAGAGETDLIMWSGDNEVQIRQVHVKIDVEQLGEELASMFPRTTIEIDSFRSMVIVKGTLSRAEQITQLHDFLDTQDIDYIDMTILGGVQQVLLQVRVAEVSRTAIRSLGVNFFDGGEDFFGGVTIGSASGGALNPINVGPAEGVNIANNIPFTFNTDVGVSSSITIFGGFPDKNFQFFIQALAENQYLRILAEPTLVALSGEDASFLVGGEYPIPVAQDVSGGGSSITIEYREFGVRLSFRPTVLGDGTIRLYVAPEVSELTDVGAVVISGFRIPGVATRRAETTLQLRNRQTFVMAGLISRTVTARSSRIPGAGDIPILGALFRSSRHSSGETELVVLVTASLVEPMDTPALWPGIGQVDPNDWEFYVLGRIEGNVAAALPASAEDLRLLQGMGLHRLRGPGAWARHRQHVVGSRAVPAPGERTGAPAFSQVAGVPDETAR